MRFQRSITGLFLVGLISLAACASQIMEGYVGKSITEPMLDYGRPTTVFNLPDGRRAFQWSITSSGAIPVTNTTNANVYGTTGWANVTTTSTSYQPFEQTCLYTLFGEAQGDDWIVTGFRQPTVWCE